MHSTTQIAPGIHWIGVNDRRKHLFENLWPLPRGVSYNSYLVVDERSALLDTLEGGSDGSYIERIEELLGERPLDYLVIDHMELDHAGQVEEVLRRWPQLQIVGNVHTLKILESYYGARAVERFMQVKEGDQLDLGGRKLRFVLTPWLHWPETMMCYEPSEGILFSGDAFGCFGTLDGVVVDPPVERYEGEMRRYYSNIVGKYSGMVQKALAKLCEVEVKMICSLHGPVWQRHAAQIVGLYDRWSRFEAEAGAVIVYASMYENTARLADRIAMGLAEHGVREIRVHDISKTHLSFILSDIWRFKGVVLGSCAYNSGMFPLMEGLCRELQHVGLKERTLGIFGSYSFSGGGVRGLLKWAEEIGWQQPATPIDMHGRATGEKFAACDAFCKAMALEIQKK